MAEGFALGVDLGTSNTVAVLRWPDGRTRPLLFDGVPLLPSAVYLNSQGGLHVGRDALRLAALDPARLEPNPKRRIDEATVLLGSQEVSTVDLLAAVLAAVARAAGEAAGARRGGREGGLAAAPVGTRAGGRGAVLRRRTAPAGTGRGGDRGLRLRRRYPRRRRRAQHRHRVRRAGRRRSRGPRRARRGRGAGRAPGPAARRYRPGDLGGPGPPQQHRAAARPGSVLGRRAGRQGDAVPHVVPEPTPVAQQR